jgi:surface polysaccharide O-acyltransferase-like enzyme
MTDAYGNHAVGKMILDFLGVLNLTGKLGYNPTWWFYSCIIVLYLLYPLLHKKLSNK